MVTHRLSDTRRINSLCDDIKEVEILKLDFPIEFYISDMNPKKDEIIFSFTTAFFTCSILTGSFNVSVLDLTGFSISEKWVPMYRRFINDIDQRIKLGFFIGCILLLRILVIHPYQVYIDIWDKVHSLPLHLCGISAIISSIIFNLKQSFAVSFKASAAF